MEGQRCKTKYPILLVHGTGFRDRKRICYWGRIPKALENNGARVFFGNQDSWGKIEDNGQYLASRVDWILRRTDAEKVNIIAHSKGGLDARYLISGLGYHQKVASLTTVCTPHHGSKTMDRLIHCPDLVFRGLAHVVNSWCRLFGDKSPDFYGTCRQFTTKYITRFNEENPDMEGVYYQSFAASMEKVFNDFITFPSFLLIRKTEGENDGLVTLASAEWTNFRGVWRSQVRRGISHSDAVDYKRRNFTILRNAEGITDIRKVYIDLVAELKDMGF